MAMMFVFCFLMMITIMTMMVVDDKDVERSWIGLRFFRCFFMMFFVLLQNSIHDDGNDDAINDDYDNDNDVGGL